LVLLFLPLSASPVPAEQTGDEFVEVRDVIPGIIVDLKYAGPDNVFGMVLYENETCLLRKNVASALGRVQEKLKERDLQLVIWDAYRPLSAQKMMWLKMPDDRYVADPKKGSRHNRGAAVDLTLADMSGTLLPMPTEYDDFSRKAHRNFEHSDKEAAANSKLLEEVMTSEGFTGLPTEWWHYDYEGWSNYPITDTHPDKLIKQQKLEASPAGLK
jgi:D-alanyl-D-alanine dipeptidase